MTQHGAAVLEHSLTSAVESFGVATLVHPVHLSPPAGEEVVTAGDFLHPDAFAARARSLSRHTDRERRDLLMASASNLMRRYLGVAVTAALVPLAHGVGLDVSLPRFSLVLRDGIPMASVIDLDGPPMTASGRAVTLPVVGRDVGSVADLRRAVLERLFGSNVLVAIDRAARAVTMPPRLLWTTAAEQVDALYEGSRLDPGHPLHASAVDDAEAVLRGAALPGVPGPNPLPDLLLWERFDDGSLPHPVQLRRQCCLCHLIREPSTHCCSCPLLDHDARGDRWRALADRRAANPGRHGLADHRIA